VLPLEKHGKNLGLDFYFGQVITVPISATGTQGEQPLDFIESFLIVCILF